VQKIIQRTFEFESGSSAAEAMVTMLMHTQGTAANTFAIENSNKTSTSKSKPTLDPRFGLDQGGCRFEVSRPLKVLLHGLGSTHGEVGGGCVWFSAACSGW
jgi:hypothetical protein